jgi:hypothetical protein
MLNFALHTSLPTWRKPGQNAVFRGYILKARTRNDRDVYVDPPSPGVERDSHQGAVAEGRG